METERNPPSPGTGTFFITRALILRGLGLIYFIAFLSLAQQLMPLLGSRGLLPIDLYLTQVLSYYGGSFWKAFREIPSLFWFGSDDTTLAIAAWGGLALSIPVILGRANSIVFFLLWIDYLSFANVGQIFYGYGWESLLLEAGFLAIFTAPALRTDLLIAAGSPGFLNVLLYRWIVFRVILGAGLIKLRSGDPCWRELTCMIYHYETQPLPNPLSWRLHNMPEWFHVAGALYNHFVELIVPWFLLFRSRLAWAAGFFLILFQLLLILSGNLSWLNWLTIVLCFSCFDDRAFAKIVPAGWSKKIAQFGKPAGTARTYILAALAGLIGLLSIAPAANMLSPGQVMNASFEPLRIVNTYGAFGTVGRKRLEIIIEGTADEHVTPSTVWSPYEFKCKPGSVDRRPCVIAPYQYRLDWQIWFSPLTDFPAEPWLVHLVAKLLSGDRATMRLFANDPFPDRPPRFVRGEMYLYHFTKPGDGSADWWTREKLGDYFRPISITDRGLIDYLTRDGWIDRLD